MKLEHAITTGSPDDIAEALLDLHQGNMPAAVTAFEGIVASNDVLFRKITQPLIHSAIQQIVSGVNRKRRDEIWKPQPQAKAQPAKGDQSIRIKALVRSTRTSLLDFPLLNGLKLRDARRPDVIAAANWYRNRSVDMGIKTRWLDAIAVALPDDRTAVPEVFTNAKLKTLQMQATKQATTNEATKPNDVPSSPAAVTVPDRTGRRLSNNVIGR